MTAKARLSRAESSARTRVELVDAARAVFLDRGYHGATLDAVAEAAGFTTGAVYSAFRGKADLFLAVLEDHLAERVRQMEEVGARAQSVSDLAHVLARQFADVSSDNHGWGPLVIEFWAHAAREANLRQQFAAQHDALKAAIARMVAETLDRTGQQLLLRPEEVATVAAALANGLTLERLAHPGAVPAQQFAMLAETIMKGISR